jgi:hypothetical protein
VTLDSPATVRLVPDKSNVNLSSLPPSSPSVSVHSPVTTPISNHSVDFQSSVNPISSSSSSSVSLQSSVDLSNTSQLAYVPLQSNSNDQSIVDQVSSLSPSVSVH